MNRCLAEGRQRFTNGLARIESGAECERLAPLLSALVDGEAGADEVAALRPHLRTCLACRARLREYREAPARAAALVPPVAGVPLAIAWLQERAAGLAARWQTMIEAASASKIAAVTASTAVLAGGGVATVTTAGDADATRPASHAVSRSAEPPRESPARAPAAAASPRRGRPTGSRRGSTDAPSEPAAGANSPPADATAPPPADEFSPAPDTSARPVVPGEDAPEPPNGPGGEFAP